MIDDRAVETSLRRYRPVTRLPVLRLQTARTWPWALAAAVLLLLALGLHGRPESDDTTVPVDARRLQVIRDDLAGTPHADTVASWIAHREAIAGRPVSEPNASAPLDQTLELR